MYSILTLFFGRLRLEFEFGLDFDVEIFAHRVAFEIDGVLHHLQFFAVVFGGLQQLLEFLHFRGLLLLVSLVNVQQHLQPRSHVVGRRLQEVAGLLRRRRHLVQTRMTFNLNKFNCLGSFISAGISNFLASHV